MSRRVLRMTGLRAWMAAACIIAIAAFYLTRAFTTRHIAYAQVAVIPFTLTADVYDMQADPNGKVMIQQTMMRRSDGSTVRIEKPGPGEVGPPVRTMRLMDGRGYQIYDSIAAITPWPTLNSQSLASYKSTLSDPPANCTFPGETYVGVGSDYMLGYTVYEVNWRSTSAGQDTEWRAPALQCQSLQQRVQIRQQDGSLKTATEVKALSINVGEPDPDAFAVPSAYATMKPSEAFHKAADSLSVAWTPQMANGAQFADAAAAGTPPPPQQAAISRRTAVSASSEFCLAAFGGNSFRRRRPDASTTTLLKTYTGGLTPPSQ